MIISLSIIKDSKSSFAVYEGDTFNYLISEAEFDAIVGSNTMSSTGIKLNNENIPTGTIMVVNITKVKISSVSFTYTAQEQQILGIINLDLEKTFLTSGIYSILGTLESLTTDWEGSMLYYENGFNMYFIFTFLPFFEAEQETWDNIDSIEENMNSIHSTITDPDLNYEIFYLKSERNNILVTEWLLTWSDQRHNDLFNASLTATSQLKIAFDKTNGVVLGSNYEGYCSGELNDFDVDISMKLKIESLSYDLPDFEFNTTGGLVKLDLIFIIGNSAVLFVIIGIVKKRKKVL